MSKSQNNSDQAGISHTKALNLIWPYLKNFGHEKIVVGVALDNFESVLGIGAVESLIRFVRYGQKYNIDTDIIAGTIAHDLRDCETECFSPRSSSY